MFTWPGPCKENIPSKGMLLMASSRAQFAHRSRLRPIVAFTMASGVALGGIGLASASNPAQADAIGPGYLVPGIEDGGVQMWLGGLENKNDPNWLQWCIEAGKPIPEAKATGVATLADVADNGQGEFRATTPQMAWILENKEKLNEKTSRAAISFLMHANYDLTGSRIVSKMIDVVSKRHPDVIERAKAYLDEARRSAVVGYENSVVEGESKREGRIKNIAVTNEAGELVAGREIEVSLHGPAKFKETGTQEWKGRTAFFTQALIDAEVGD